MTGAKPRETGRLWLPLYFGATGHLVPHRRQHANLRVCVLGGNVHLKIGDGEEVVLDAARQEEFSQMWVASCHETDAQASTGGAP
jgi:hypothetical protein